jgi:hypothetical protein
MAFILGVLATFFAFILQVFVWIFHPDLFTLTAPLTAPILFSLLFLAFSEELSRTLFVRQYLHTYAKGSWVLAALLFGVGFSLLEIVLTFWNGFSLQVLGASGLHMVASFLAFWWLLQSRNRTSFIVLLVLLTALHACFNLSLLNLV